ncbi:MAG TPA: BTAD domain-containing putative transcriptional regulator [Solirubrobacteraceae bacterium]|nr:BTAD domain-containing putative transcriptional regulator [Solirubrobacteraceae bacterium]
MELRVLGPLEASEEATPLPLGGPKPRALLARLALEANRTVAAQRLIDDLWGDTVPESAPKMIQIYVSQLRKVLPEGVLLTRPPGYVVEVPPEAVDVTRFRELHHEGRAALAAGDAGTAADRLRAALALWRGPALAEFSEPFARVEGAHLEELRMVCIEERIEADLALGLHADVAGELEALVARHPLRERLHAQLILALYRAGRQAEALAAYERFRRALDDELGIEPSGALKALQHRILNQHPSLELAGLRAPAPAVAADRFVGRAGELDRLDAALAAAAAGAGTTVLVAGPAGIGKTRLTSELGARARAGEGTVLAGRCIQLVGAGLPYLPLVEALRPLGDSLAGLRELPRLIPGLPGALAAAERSDAKLALFEEVLAVLDRLGGPVVLVVEDLQWADESTLDLVAFLAHAVRSRRILVAATYRSDEVRPGDPLHRLATGLAASGAAAVLALEPLPFEDVRALLAAWPEPLPADVVAAIAARSEGNPFFARELAAAAARRETELPPGLRDVLLGHVARLDGAARAVLRVLAAAGRDVSYRLLDAVMPLDELGLAGALRQAVELDVVLPDQAAGTFRFRHALFAEAVYATLLPGEREALHQRLARALTDEPHLAASGAAAAEAAQHWAAAGRPVEALGASLQAAREAEAVSGLTEALKHVERVLSLWDQVPEAEELSGVALPSVLAWAGELAGASARDGEADGPLAVAEARRLYPSVVVLESLAIRQAPRFDAGGIAELRAANARMLAAAAAGDPAAAIVADDDFHRRLTADCGNAHLLAALDPVRRGLMRYERVYMREPARVERSVAQHDAIVTALERGDHAEAAQLLRGNLSGGLPDLREALER